MRKNMRAERARRGLTVKSVADTIGVHSNAVSRWESGESEPTSSNLLALCRLYGDVSPEYLLDMTSDPHGTAVAEARP